MDEIVSLIFLLLKCLFYISKNAKRIAFHFFAAMTPPRIPTSTLRASPPSMSASAKVSFQNHGSLCLASPSSEPRSASHYADMHQRASLAYILSRLKSCIPPHPLQTTSSPHTAPKSGSSAARFPFRLSPPLSVDLGFFYFYYLDPLLLLLLAQANFTAIKATTNHKEEKRA